MKKDKLKGFISGFLIASLVMSAGTIAFAATGSKTITAAYNNIKIYVNEKLVTPKDAAGNTVEPFIYNGTTYLPVRAVADALGQEVSWNNTTKSVYIGTQPKATTTIKNTSNKTAVGSVVFDKGGIKVTYIDSFREYNYDGTWHDSYEFKIENHADYQCMVSTDDESIDGVEYFLSMARSVNPGNTAYTTIDIYQSILQEYAHLSDYDTIKTKIHVYDNDEWDNDMYSEFLYL